MRKKRKRRKMYLEHLVFLATYPSGYPSGAYWKEGWKDKTFQARYVRCYRGQRSKQIKKRCNRRFRRKREGYYDTPNGCAYRKVTEFWWEYC